MGWAIAIVGTGASFIFALLLQSVTENGARISYSLGNWEPPWGIEFVVDSASSLTLVVMSGLGFLATLAARQLVINEIAEKDMSLRGYGDILGFQQSGIKNFKFADPIHHKDLFFLMNFYLTKL